MKSTDEPEAYRELKAKLADREWRLDNLYWVQNEAGQAVRFVRNEAQRLYWQDQWYLNTILKARQLGFSTLIAISTLDACLFNSNTSAGLIDYTLPDAKKKLEKIKFALDRLPEDLLGAIKVVKANTEEIALGNGSSIQVGTSHRGGTLQILHVSEYGKISANSPLKAKEIKTGAFGTIHSGQMIHVESTAEGIGGEFYEMVQRAEAHQKQGKPLSPLDFKLHFFPWWRHPGYRIPAHLVTVSLELEDYIGELRGKYGINLDAEQKAWYAAKQNQIGPDDIKREYPSTSDEAFLVSIEGAYFKRQMSKARADGRIGDVPHDPHRKVNTWWDIGRDTTSIWFHQTDGLRHRLINYYENSGEVIGHYIKEVRKIGEQNEYQFGTHLGPHDFGNVDWGGLGKTRVKMAEDLGFMFEVVPRVEDKADAIEAARAMLPMCWIDEKRCARGIACLDNYRKQWNEERSVWSQQPVHNWASHGADSFMTGACGHEPEIMNRKPTDRHRRHRDAPRSAWTA
jgi:hypothetical protein